MPDLKNKYSDPELNPANKDFDEIVNRPDMRALNDQGDAIARDLKNAESDTKDPGSPSDDNSEDEIIGAEKSGGEAPENRFSYQKAETKIRGWAGWSRRRKILTGAGAGGGIIGIMMSLFMLLPLKIPGIMQMISDEAGQRVEQITEKRAKYMIGRYILNHAMPNKFVFTGEGAVSDLMKSMRTARFEKKLEAKGIRIEAAGNEGVRIRINNELIGNGDILKNDVDVVRALDGSPASRRIINEIVKEEIPSWRWMKRAKFAKWLRLKYGIPRYGVENSSNSDEEERVKEMQENRLKVEYEALASDMGEAVECVIGTDCDVDTEGEGRPSDMPTSGDASNVAGDIEGSVDETIDANTGPPGQGAQKTLITTVLDKLGSKAIPIIGWIDLLATADHIAWEATENDYFGKVASFYRAQQYARHYGVWSGYGSQIQLGAMDPEFISVLAKQTEGIEEAQAFSYIQGDASRGVPVEKIDSNSRSGFADDLKQLQTLLAPASSLPGVRESTHAVLNLYYETIGGGGLLGWASDHLGSLFTGILSKITPPQFEEWIGKLMVKVGGKLFEIMGLDFDPMISGAGWMNAAHGGATWTYNDFCKNEMGCRKLTPEQTAQQNAAIAAERSTYRQQKGLAYALFSTETSSSVLSQMTVSTPTSFTSAATSIGRFISNTPATALGLITPKTSASSYVDIHGVDPYGALGSELDAPIDQTAAEGGSCGETFDGNSLNLCQTDTLVAEAMICEFEPESEGCGEDTTDEATGGIEFTIASYNILHSEHHTGKSIQIGGCGPTPPADDPHCMKERARLQMKIFEGGAGNPAFDIVGTQETAPEQYNYIKQELTSYDVFPEDASRMTNQLDGATAIWWNKDKFTKFASGKFPSLSNVLTGGAGRGEITQPWVGLQAASGHKFYVTSVHYATSTFGGTPEVMRQSAQYAIDWVKSIAGQDATVFVVGDFNDRLSEKLTYCVMTRDGVTMHARDLANGVKPGKECPVPNNNGVSIDHIYATPTEGMVVEKWQDMTKGSDPILARASDHTPVYSTINFPSSEGSLRLATFNILHVGDSDFEKQWRTRLPTSIGVLKDNGIAVAGLQEVRPEQHKLLTSEAYATDTYDIFPKTAEQPNFSPNPVIWNKSMYKLVSGKTLPIEYDSGSKIDHAVLVLLEDIEGNQFYVLNTHDPANARPGSNEQNALSRLNNAKYYTQHLGDLAKEGKPVFLTGDFNSSYTMSGNQQPYNNQAQNLTYCVVSSGGVMTNVWDTFENKKFTCPRNNSPDGAPIDHIYTGNVSGVNKVWTAESRENGSDHPTVMADIYLPWSKGDGGGGGGTATGWVWPLKSNINPGPCYGGSHVHAGMDMNSSTSNNPVYAMHTGTVAAIGSGGDAGNYITIKASVSFHGKPVYYSYEHLQAGSIPSSVKRGAKVLSGQKVGIAGLSGNVDVDSSKAHLHIVTATTNTLGSYGNLSTTFNPMDILKSVNPAPGGYRCYPT